MTLVARRAFSRLPRFLRNRLDPFEGSVERFLQRCAASLLPSQRILDAGSGESPHAMHFRHARYFGVDSCIGDNSWDYSQLHARADLHRLPFHDEVFEAVLCVVVLEHVTDPLTVLKEFKRVTKKGGQVWLVTPLLWEEHQKPVDYYRFTSDGLRLLLDRAGLKVQEISSVGGLFWLLGRRSINFLSFFQKGWRWTLFVPLAPIFGLLLPLICFSLDPFDHNCRFTLGHTTVATPL